LESIEVKSAVETLDPTKVKLTVEVTYDELKPSITHAYEHIAEQVTVPGFRKGKVPPRIIDQRVGRPAVIEHAVNEGLGGFYAEAVRENNLRPLGQPDVQVTQVPGLTSTAAGEEGELHFTAEIEVRPTITLPALEDITVSVDDTEVSDEDVQGRLDALRERFGSLVGVDRPATDGDFVQIDLVATIGDEEIDRVSGISYQIGSGNMLEGLDEALTSLSAGETTTFESAPLGGGPARGAVDRHGGPARGLRPVLALYRPSAGRAETGRPAHHRAVEPVGAVQWKIPRQGGSRRRLDDVELVGGPSEHLRHRAEHRAV